MRDYANTIIGELNTQYGEDFNWFIPENPKFFEEELQREMTQNHSLKVLKMKALARNMRNDDVLFTDDERFYMVHLTWAKESSASFPYFFVLEKENLKTFLETDFLEE